jgi:hypothetical protein
MSAPWMKFYPADWRADPRLRICSLAARGLWIDLISYMHEGEPYGTLTIDGAVPELTDIAALVGRPLAEVRRALAELEARQVFSRDHGLYSDAIFSRRMRRDRERADRDRVNGRAGGNPALRKSDKPGVNPPDKAQSPDSRIQNPESDSRTVAGATGPEDAFEKFRKAYPKRKGGNPWQPARKLFAAALKGGADPEQMIGAVKAGVGFDREKIGTEYIPQAATWLRDRRWEDFRMESAGPAKVFIRQDDPRFAAWLAYLRKSSVPIVNGGWYFDAEHPPDDSTRAPQGPSEQEHT